MNGVSRFWVGVVALLVLAGAAVWAEMQHRPAAAVNATPAAAAAPEQRQAPAPAQAPQEAPHRSSGPVGDG